ncbi:hypothetical protein EDB87DRAFT_84509 [Lactarius vividus]|nr:hypothetical protein EDB87DRAFT_84509 [Lactarius vividus]
MCSLPRCSQSAMYRHAKRDVHIFSESWSPLKVNPRAVPPRKPPLNYPQTPVRAQNRIGVYPQQLEAVIPSPPPVILDSRPRHPSASANVTTEPSNEVHTHYEFSSTPSVPKNSNFPRVNVTNAYASLVWERFQNSLREFEEFEWHLRCATLLFFNLLATIYRLWLFSAWYIFTNAFQAFLVNILIPQFSTVCFAVVTVFRDLTPAWVLSIVGIILSLVLEAIEVSIKLARRANHSNVDEWQNAHTSTPTEKTVKVVDIPCFWCYNCYVVRSSAYGEKQSSPLWEPLVMTCVMVMPMGRAERLSTILDNRKLTAVLHIRRIRPTYPTCLIRH